ncbi:ankyrin repeat domain-containing protein [Aneurinibacillus uraniidurans]|uniref:ankyrin repeat domain-containing protein n=1 Tax=Aneurinibacillus uraniidurans TaxID=2966586 RepID=UPI00234B3D17|nr:ankyrin repeat domain-containing protein [Aneurinibacillus sp. B1]WCN39387.1 ankyrin repeat domain-containing protein [Aneurinibacillus sp. B1]
MKLFSENTELTPIVNMILDEDIDGLRKELENGWNINKEIQAGKYVRELPILIALDYNKLKVVDFLIENGAELNMKGKAVIPAAADSCSLETIKVLLKHGADLHAVNNVGSNAIHRALINKRYDLMIELISLGIDVKKDGTILRSAVYKRDYQAIKILLDQNIDVNHHTPDMVFPYNSTPVCVATQNNDFDTVKLLVEHGADVTIKDAYGERPFSAAQKNKNHEMMEYIKALEPEEWHNQEQRLIALKSYKLPQKLVEFLCGNNLRLDINNKYASYVIFNSLVDCKEVKWNGYKFLDLLSDVDNYSAEGFLVWYPKGKCLAIADYEHEEFKILDKWDDFIKNPSNTIDKIFE